MISDSMFNVQNWYRQYYAHRFVHSLNTWFNLCLCLSTVWFRKLLFWRNRQNRETRLHSYKPRHFALSQSYQGHIRVHHQHQQDPVCVHRRGRTAYATSKMDSVLQFCYVNLILSFVVGIRPSPLRRQVIIHSLS